MKAIYLTGYLKIVGNQAIVYQEQEKVAVDRSVPQDIQVAEQLSII
ncbi:hypothetical protein [Ammoniphilus sp. 3BR4]